ncbi:MAG: FGGY family carbohydrate kinase [Desulfurococcaceae archaeon]
MNILTVDLGTTNLKVSLVNINEKEDRISVIESITRRITPLVPAPNAHEHNPAEIKQELFEIIRHMSRKYIIDAVITSTYLFATVIVNRKLEPLTNIITWIDERSDKYVNLVKNNAFEIYRRTGCPPLHIYTLPKILWLKHENPSLINGNLILDAKALLSTWFLNYPITDLSTASGTYQMLNISSLKWDSSILEIAGISEDQLPELNEAYYIDYISEKTSRELNFRPGSPFILGLYDGGSMIYGLSMGKYDVGVVNLGTSGMLRVVVDKPIVDHSPSMRFQTYYLTNRQWLSGSGINNAGVILEFLIKLLNLDFKILDTLLNQDPPDPIKTPLVIPLLYKERLPMVSTSTGFSIHRIKPETTIDHIIWGTVEGILMLIKLIEEALLENSINFNFILLGGGLARYRGLINSLATLLNKRTGVLRSLEASHLGCALLALSVLGEKKKVKDVVYKVQELLDYVDPALDLADHYSKKYEEFKRHVIRSKEAC